MVGPVRLEFDASQEDWKVKDQAAIVLGAGKGLGKTICHRLSGKSRCLMLAGRS